MASFKETTNIFAETFFKKNFFFRKRYSNSLNKKTEFYLPLSTPAIADCGLK
tara:strand:+ start:1912 stop:2067 length:156 start_codon:yes stop_codon:yes gene_type:complete